MLVKCLCAMPTVKVGTGDGMPPEGARGRSMSRKRSARTGNVYQEGIGTYILCNVCTYKCVHFE